MKCCIKRTVCRELIQSQWANCQQESLGRLYWLKKRDKLKRGTAIPSTLRKWTRLQDSSTWTWLADALLKQSPSTSSSRRASTFSWRTCKRAETKIWNFRTNSNRTWKCKAWRCQKCHTFLAKRWKSNRSKKPSRWPKLNTIRWCRISRSEQTLTR